MLAVLALVTEVEMVWAPMGRLEGVGAGGVQSFSMGGCGGCRTVLVGVEAFALVRLPPQAARAEENIFMSSWWGGCSSLMVSEIAVSLPQCCPMNCGCILGK